MKNNNDFVLMLAEIIVDTLRKYIPNDKLRDKIFTEINTRLIKEVKYG